MKLSTLLHPLRKLREWIAQQLANRKLTAVLMRIECADGLDAYLKAEKDLAALLLRDARALNLYKVHQMLDLGLMQLGAQGFFDPPIAKQPASFTNSPVPTMESAWE